MDKTKVYFAYDDDIINPCWDNVFKAIFTKETLMSRNALSKLLSAIIGRELTVIMITANEPAIDNLRDRQIRYDINCKFEDGSLANIEMTVNPDPYEPVRLEYYGCKLMVTQDIRGDDRTYKDLKHTYQISMIVNKPIFEDMDFIHYFQYYDSERKVSLDGRTHIITLELSKLDRIAKKQVKDMTPAERWAVFFRYSVDKGRRELVNEILAYEEGIAMAGEVLLTISKDEVERFRMTSEYKYEVDLQSKMVHAKRSGLEEGRKEGERIGELRGRQEGEYEKAMEIAKNLLLMGLSPEQIVKASGLPLNEIEKLKE